MSQNSASMCQSPVMTTSRLCVLKSSLGARGGFPNTQLGRFARLWTGFRPIFATFSTPRLGLCFALLNNETRNAV